MSENVKTSEKAGASQKSSRDLGFLTNTREQAKSGDRSRFDVALDETEKAYRDCHTDDSDAAINVRNLSFECSVEVGRDSAEKIMQVCVPEGYNEFDAKLIALLPEDSKIRIAREGSVCLYVRTDSTIDNTYLKADELDWKRGVCRIWWD